MQEWADVAYGQIMQEAMKDPMYQQLLDVCRSREETYRNVLEKLPREDVQSLEEYISACEEMEHRLAQLAYEFGKTRI